MPAVSVIIPARDAAATLPRTLASLAAQDVEASYEVIVVDDGSSDDTAAVAGRAPGTRVIRQGPAGPGPARNAGVAAARADALAFTDADCFPEPGWLAAGIAALAHADLVQGHVRPDPGKFLPFDRTVGVPAETGLYETANLFIRRPLFDRLGGFEDWLPARMGKPLAEDVWLGWRARRAGARVAFAPDAVVDHAVFRRGPAAYVGERVRLTYFPFLAAKIPELRRTFFYLRAFHSRRTAAFDTALVGALGAVGLGSPLPLLAAAPYAAISARWALKWGRRAPIVAVVDLVADAVGFAALAWGSLRARSLLL